MNPYYREYADYLASFFNGKVQKISIDLGGTCPNRDGTSGYGGCIYCRNDAFSPDYGKAGLNVIEQIERGQRFFAHKYPHMKFLAYFQSNTSTHGDITTLLDAFSSALYADSLAGIIIGTRPDCMPDAMLNALADLKEDTRKPVFIEFGVESMHDSTLMRINRHHTAQCAIDAIKRTAAAGLEVGIHLILGLPGEDTEMMKRTVDIVSSLPVSSVKFHQLQILRGTVLERLYMQGTDVSLFTPEEYVGLCARLLRHLRKDIAVDRWVAQAPPDLVVAPKWGLKNYQFRDILLKYLASTKFPSLSRL